MGQVQNLVDDLNSHLGLPISPCLGLWYEALGGKVPTPPAVYQVVLREQLTFVARYQIPQVFLSPELSIVEPRPWLCGVFSGDSP